MVTSTIASSLTGIILCVTLVELKRKPGIHSYVAQTPLNLLPDECDSEDIEYYGFFLLCFTVDTSLLMWLLISNSKIISSRNIFKT